jgi:hypothetical protein
MKGLLRTALPCLVMLVSIHACTSSAAEDETRPPSSSAAPAGVTLVLVPTHASGGCCRVFTVNPGDADATVICTLQAVDPSGRVVYSGFIPGSPPGRRRPISGFKAPPGRQGHGVFQLPIDPNHDSYTAPCRPAAWHGGAPL